MKIEDSTNEGVGVNEILNAVRFEVNNCALNERLKVNDRMGFSYEKHLVLIGRSKEVG